MNCKPGTIGLVNRKARHVENIGVLVEVVRLYAVNEVLPGHGAPYPGDRDHGWVCRAIGREFVVPCLGGGSFNAEFHCVRDIAITPFKEGEGNEEFVVKARKSLVIERQNDKLKKVPA
jgi:hypothetical protein